ncbi:MAG: MSMEG_0567/Sll0786 family nitrogen starvation N-acetyltransferase [Planctomycetota bacterium]
MTPFFDPVARFTPSEYRCKFVEHAWEAAAYGRLRRDVFCGEQGIFDDDDRDAIDDFAKPIVAVSMLGVAADDVVGCVRIDEREPGVWFGSRLAVRPDVRGAAPLAAQLIRKAVRSAHALGCHRFLAHVQRRNVRLFRRLHWEKLDEVLIHGRPHALMQADLEHYPALLPSRPLEVLLRPAAA